MFSLAWFSVRTVNSSPPLGQDAERRWNEIRERIFLFIYLFIFVRSPSWAPPKIIVIVFLFFPFFFYFSVRRIRYYLASFLVRHGRHVAIHSSVVVVWSRDARRNEKGTRSKIQYPLGSFSTIYLFSSLSLSFSLVYSFFFSLSLIYLLYILVSWPTHDTIVHRLTTIGVGFFFSFPASSSSSLFSWF